MSRVALKRGNKLIPERLVIAGKLAPPLTPYDRNPEEVSYRTFLAQKHWFEVKRLEPSQFEYQRRQQAAALEKQLIWRAFDAPELIGILFNDAALRGDRSVYDASGAWIDTAIHWVGEARYWRTIGISRPYYDEHTLRAHCWQSHGTDIGNLQLSAAMTHAMMDMERALKRKAQGLDPNYVWDLWGPSGFIDGRRNDYLPRPDANPYRDPDNVEVAVEDVLPYVTHESIKERYAEFITADPTPFQGVFLAPSHGGATMAELPSESLRDLLTQLHAAWGTDASRGAKSDRNTEATASTDGEDTALAEEASLVEAAGAQGTAGGMSPTDARAVWHLAADEELAAKVQATAKTWGAVLAATEAARATSDLVVDAARLVAHTTRGDDDTRSFYEEKCGWLDFMKIPDKVSTGAVIAQLADLRAVVAGAEWGPSVCLAQTDVERERAMGPAAFRVFRAIEDAALERRRKKWATRFTGEAHEERALDYMLQSFGRRTESPTAQANTRGDEFDRDDEPIGRRTQRRIMDADIRKAAPTREKQTDLFAKLHRQQTTSGRIM